MKSSSLRTAAWLLGVFLSCCALGVPRAASADTALIESFEAPPECPDASWFVAEVRERTRASSELAGAVRVKIERTTSGYVGRVQRVQFQTDQGTREVFHESCEQVVRALALISALILDPEAARDEAAPQAARDVSPPASGSAPAPAGLRVRYVPSLPLQRKPRSAGMRMHHGLNVGLALRSFVGPGVHAGLRAGYRIVLEHGGLESELGLAFERVQSGTIDVEEIGSAALTYSAGRLELCEGWGFVRGLRLAPCGFLDFGALSGRGQISGASNGITRAALWLSPGLAARIEWRPLHPMSVQASAGLFYPLSRPEFHFTVEGATSSAHSVQRTPENVGLSAGLAVGLLFP